MNPESESTGFEIAVIGMSGRFPGARNVAEYWEHLKNGKECLSFFSDEELKEAGKHTETINNKNYVKVKGIFPDIEYFDALFFDYTPKEAELMDPQMRVFHECAYEALENANYDPVSYDGLIGLFAGATPNHYWEGLAKFSGKTVDMGAWESTQFIDKDYLCSRISYKLNLKGPSFSMYTACSTSLVSVHLGCQALLNGECDIALAGGVTVALPNFSGYKYIDGMIMSPDGHCRAFDARGAGIVGGNGAGLVVLKRLQEAVEDKDYIHAVIKGTAINNDGIRKSAFTAPSIEGQVEVIRMAQQMAHVEPESITYIESHGTATDLGDPIEFEALKLAFDTGKKGFCKIGSVKTNLGHVDSAAGVASLIKTVLSLKNRLIPPSLHFEHPDPKIDFENSPFRVNSELAPWVNDRYPLRAGVSSFGIGGTNAHVIVEEWSASNRSQGKTTNAAHALNHRPPGSATSKLVLLSAKTGTALETMTGNLVDYLKENRGEQENTAAKDRAPSPSLNPAGNGENGCVDLDDMAYSLQVGRSALKYRRMAVCDHIDEVIDLFSAPDSQGVRTFLCKAGKNPVVFMFSGQGSQYVNMGLGLYRSEPRFREDLDHCFDILHQVMGSDIRDVLYPAGSIEEAEKKITEFIYAAPLKFVFEYSLARLLMNWGITPYAMIGHSFGEYLAAAVSGVFSIRDAVELMVYRARLFHRMPEGVMLSVPLSEKELQPFLNDNLSLAAVNGPELCIVSGPIPEVNGFEAEMKKRELDCVRLKVPRAAHSAMMDPILKEFEEKVSSKTLAKPQIPYVSNVTGNWITVEEATDPHYWARHLRSTVRFFDGINRLLQEENSIFVEVGSGRSLETFLKQHKDKKPGHRVMNLIRHRKDDVDDMRYFLDKIGLLWLYGQKIDWEKFHENEKPARIPLPTYPFQRQRYWIDAAPVKIDRPDVLNKEDSSDPSQDGPGSAKIEEEESRYNRPEISSPYAAPVSDTEKMLAGFWQEFFGIRAVGIDDDFFELGGDSLKAINICGRIYRNSNVDIPVSEFFSNPTVKELALYIDSMEEDSKFYAVQPVEKREYYPLTAPQERFYFLQQIDAKGIGYNMWQTLELGDVADKKKFADAFHGLVDRHEGLRTSFEPVDGTPVQRIHETIDFHIEYLDAVSSGRAVRATEKQPDEPGEQKVTPEEKQGQVVSDIIKNFIRPFDLSRPPLLRIGLIQLAENRHVLVIDWHHIITDAASQRALVEDFVSFYVGDELNPLKIKYKDYSLWQNDYYAKGERAIVKQEEYWFKKLAGPLPLLNIPLDFPRPEFQSFEGSRLRIHIDKGKVEALRAIAVREGATVHMLMMSILYIMLAKLSGQEDIIIGTPIVGRSHPDLEKVIGVFINTLAHRNYPAKEKTFREFLKEVKKNSLEAYENQDYPFDNLVKKLVKKRDTSRNPFFDVLFEMQKIETSRSEKSDKEIESFKVKTYRQEVTSTFMDMDWVGIEREERIDFSITYCTKLFKKDTVEFMANCYQVLIDSIIDNENSKIGDLKYTAFEKELDSEKEVEFNF